MGLKTKRALTILVGWLEAAKVPFQVTGPEQVTVQGKGGDLPVRVAEDEPSTGDVIRAADMTAPPEKALAVFWIVTEKAGFGKPQVLSRGISVDGRVRYSDDPELVAMRHREFRQVANLPEHVYKDPNYRKIIAWYCIRFFRLNGELCHRIGYEIEDIQTYAWLYLTNFYGRWRHLDATPGENGKMFCSYLQQRLYSDLKPLLIRKAKNIAVDSETAGLGQNVEYRTQYNSKDGDSAGFEFVAIRQNPELAGYEQMMDDMEHGDLLALLTKLQSGGDMKARRLLLLHQSECMDCACRVECQVPTSGHVDTSS